MYTSAHKFTSLFQQLGLPSSDAEIARFIKNHHLYTHQVNLADATFWTAGQSSFIREASTKDSEWSELVDELDTLLRD